MFLGEMESNNIGYSCGCIQNNNNMCPYYNTENNSNMNNCEEFEMTKEAMLKEIKCYQFAIIELGLYLDTHPDDSKALCLHRKYAKELKELKDKYQKVYGPLTINYPCNKWRWLEEPWPWERGNN